MNILAHEDHLQEARDLVQRFAFTLQEGDLEKPYLRWSEGQWEFLGLDFSIRVNLAEFFKRLSQQKLSVKKDLLARAVGLDKTPGATVFDATLGLGKDTFHLAYLGASVVATDRDSLPFVLVESALKNFDSSQIKGQVQCHFSDAEDFFSNTTQVFDALYLDPMFEDVEKKSLPKKEMQFLSGSQKENRGYTDLIELALEKGVKRVVVKRPLKGAKLYSEPQITLCGKMIRYDIYQKRAIS